MFYPATRVVRKTAVSLVAAVSLILLRGSCFSSSDVSVLLSLLIFKIQPENYMSNI
jgi:hypothetical protein